MKERRENFEEQDLFVGKVARPAARKEREDNGLRENGRKEGKKERGKGGRKEGGYRSFLLLFDVAMCCFDTFDTCTTMLDDDGRSHARSSCLLCVCLIGRSVGLDRAHFFAVPARSHLHALCRGFKKKTKKKSFFSPKISLTIKSRRVHVCIR